MYHYKSAYIQKGHGLGGIFRGIRNFFMPLARRVVTTLNKPEAKRVLKTIGKEALNTGSELVLDSIHGNDIQSTLNKRIGTAKKRIAESIEDGIKSKRTVNNIKRYQRLRDESPDRHNRINSPSTKKNSVPLFKNNRPLNRQTNPLRKNKTIRRQHKTVFD